MSAIPESEFAPAPVPVNETARLVSLAGLNILDTVPEESIDRITRLAASVFNVPIAVVTLVDEDRQWFKSCVGLDATETPRDVAFCAHAIMRDEVMVVPDATKDGRFVRNPLVTGGPQIRFYAGAPLLMSSGFKLGTLCIVDDKPRPSGLDAREKGILQDFSAMVVREIEFRHEVESETTALASDLENARTAKKQFLQMLSHELRTPLNAVIGFCSLISAEVKGPRISDYRGIADDINEAGHQLLGLIDGMLDWTRLERGELLIDERPLPVVTLLEKALSLLPDAEKRVSMPEISDGLGVLCDPRYLTQAVMHIIGNAVRFSPQSEMVRISVELRDQRALTIIVTDRGPGLDTAQQKQAFEALEQLEDQFKKTVPGIGLGLAVSRKLVELHGGRLLLESTPGKGTTVFLNLPDYRTQI